MPVKLQSVANIKQAGWWKHKELVICSVAVGIEESSAFVFK